MPDYILCVNVYDIVIVPEVPAITDVVDIATLVVGALRAIATVVVPVAPTLTLPAEPSADETSVPPAV